MNCRSETPPRRLIAVKANSFSIPIRRSVGMTRVLPRKKTGSLSAGLAELGVEGLGVHHRSAIDHLIDGVRQVSERRQLLRERCAVGAGVGIVIAGLRGRATLKLLRF